MFTYFIIKEVQKRLYDIYWIGYFIKIHISCFRPKSSYRTMKTLGFFSHLKQLL